MKVLALDIGSEETGYVILNSNPLNIEDKGKVSNLELKNKIILDELDCPLSQINIVALEMISSYGMAIGQTTIDSICWIGIFKALLESKKIKVQLIFRKTVKMHLCQSVRAKDGEVNKTLTDRYGYDSTKKNPNLFYETSNSSWMNNDIYAALALATYIIEPKDYPIKNLMEKEENKLSKSLLMSKEEHIAYLLAEKEKKRVAAKR